MKRKKLAPSTFLKYENKWVALDTQKGEVVVASDSLSGLDRKLVETKRRDVAITRVLPFDCVLAP